MCGAWRTKACPPLATWAEYAPKPVLPVKLMYFLFCFIFFVDRFLAHQEINKWEDMYSIKDMLLAFTFTL